MGNREMGMLYGMCQLENDAENKTRYEGKGQEPDHLLLDAGAPRRALFRVADHVRRNAKEHGNVGAAEFSGLQPLRIDALQEDRDQTRLQFIATGSAQEECQAREYHGSQAP